MRSPLYALLSLAPFALPGSAQIGERLFDAPVVVVDEFHRIEHLLDLDDDGYRDAVGWWWSSDSPWRNVVTGFRNDRAGGMVPVWTAEFPPAPQGSSQESASDVVDLDGDGKLDLVIGQGNVLKFFHLRGTSAPVLASNHELTQVVREISAGDVDGDGFGDALVLLASGRLQRWSNRGPSAGYSMSVTSSTFVGTNHHSLHVGELTGDGWLDALLVSADEILIVPMGPAGSMGSPLTFAAPAAFQNPMPALGDVDGDGDTDVVVFEGIAPGSDRYHVLRRTSSNTWSLESPVLGGPATELCDIDGDGDLDGICCGGGGYSPPHNEGESHFEISIQESGHFLPAFRLPSLGAVHIAGAADVDLDGDLDLVAGRVIYAPEGPLTGDPYVRLASEPVVVSDFDGDGDPDFDLSLAPMAVNDGTGAVHSAIATTEAPPPGMRFVGPGYAGDFDGDGDEDLVVGMFDGAGFVSMRLLANQGGGYFADGGDAAASGANWSLGDPNRFLPGDALVADADGDGDLDVTVRKRPNPEPSAQIWLNDGAGSFTGPYAVLRRWPLAYADFDENGTQDMVCAFGVMGARAHQAKWEPGSGPGTFLWNDLNRWLGDARIPTDRVAVLDFDGDGHLDVVTPDRPYSGLSETYVYLNKQNPNNFHLFDVEWLHPASGHQPADLRSFYADLDGDGLEDLAISSVLYAENGVAIHPGYAPNGLAPVQLFEVVAFRDVDGDGDLDAIGDAIVPNLTRRSEQSGSRRQYGTGTPGTGGAVPVLGASGSFRAGETASLRVTGGCGGAFAQLVVIDGHPGEPDWPAPGLALARQGRFRWLPLTLAGAPGAVGTGSFTLSFAVPPQVGGTAVNYIVYILDPQAAGGWSRTNGLTIHYP